MVNIICPPQSLTLDLRDYQKKAIEDLYTAIHGGETRVVVVAGTGAGKTEILIQVVMDAIKVGRCTIAVHRDALVVEMKDRLEKYGLNPSIVAGRFTKGLDINNPLQVVSIDTMDNRPDVAEIICRDVLVLDEAHTTAYRKFSKEWATKSRYLIGLTATPWRLKKKETLLDYFDHAVLAPVPRELQEVGWLVPFRYFALEGTVDTSKVDTNSEGDYKVRELSMLTSTPAVVKSAVDNWIRLAQGRRTIGFAVDVEHAKIVTREFQQRGIKAAVVHGSMNPTTERQPLYDALERGDLDVLMSCKALTEGFNVRPVSCVLDLAPTLSRALFFQKIGRGARISPETGKVDCFVLDQAGGVDRHGFLEEIDEEMLQLRPANTKQPAPAPKKKCPGCGEMLSMFVRFCPYCGHEFEPEESKRAEAIGNLVEVTPQHLRDRKLPKELRHYRKMKMEAFRKGKPPGTAMARFKRTYSNAPKARNPAWERGAIFGDDPSFGCRRQFFEYLKAVQRSNKSWTGDTVFREFEMEFGPGSFNQWLQDSLLLEG